ncbi:MAG TPA: hypothetical protein VJJ52_00155 [Candidatus Nanoarchaeia archaeon]|nr:hypothetical protein [Candidatus Nanoarchaeia archaeon]
MAFKTISLIVFLVISAFLLSSCEVYQTLYGNSATAPTGQVVSPSENESMETMVPDGDQSIEEVKSAEVMPEVVPVKSDEKPFVVVVQETDLVNLVPKAEDPDKNTDLIYTFTSPVDDSGEWKTSYGDSGEYTITVTVSDGEAATSRDVLLIVNKKEEAPTIDKSTPLESSSTIDETQSIDFGVTASDLNNDPLAYKWKLDGIEVGDADAWTYQTDYDSSGTHTVKIDVSDGLSEASKIWSVNVRNVNRPPTLEKINDIEARETDRVVITALATDADNDPVIYSISDSRFRQDGNMFTWETDYDSAGTYEVTVTADDGTDKVSQIFNVNVVNANRPPVIVDVSQE